MTLPIAFRPLVPLLLLISLTGGCHRGYYRHQADVEVGSIVGETAALAEPCLPREPFSIEVDPRSRMYDPFCRDFPPMPHDDPASHQYMHCVDGHRGYRRWHADGDTAYVESPLWELCSSCNGGETLILDTEAAVELAWINSREYQAQLESLYLSSLDVSFERFRFDSQFFGGVEAFFTSDGPDRSGSGFSSNELAIDSDAQMTKLFATGGELVVGFANSLIWEFSGSNQHTATTLLDFSLLQPLLRGSGRDVVLEQLTQSQRLLLAEVRSLERFRRGFYVNLVTGSSAGGASTAPGGGILGLLQTQQDIRNQEFSIAQLQTSLAQLEALFEAGRIDFFQVEQARQSLFNAQSVLLNTRAGYQDSLDSYKIALGLPPTCDVQIEDPIIEQFNLVDTRLIPAQNAVSQLQIKVGETVVSMLPQREVPPSPLPEGQGGLLEQQPVILRAVSLKAASGGENGDREEIEVELDGAPADDAAPEEALPPVGIGQAANQPAEIEHRPSVADAAPKIPWSENLAARLREMRGQLDDIESIREELLAANVPRARADIQRLRSSIDKRLATADELRDQLTRQLSSLEGGGSSVDPGILDLAELGELPDQLAGSLAKVEAYLDRLPDDLETHRERIDALLAEGPELQPGEVYLRLREDVFLPVPNAVGEVSAAVLELTLIQARARTESVVLEPVDLPAECALEIARLNRRDWRNQRAATVDAWRQIAVTANDLESGLDVVFSGDIGNTGDNPFRLQGETGRLQVGLQFDAPLTRLVERNNYREAQINFQQARRAQYAFEDEVSRSLRSILRTLELNRLDFELQRVAVQVAIQQVELTRLRLREPPRPGQTQQQASPTTTRDLVGALASLLQAQNSFLRVWVGYESLRRQLDFELGTMQLDREGLWIDPGEIDESICPPFSSCECQQGPASIAGFAEPIRRGEPTGPRPARNPASSAVFHAEAPGPRAASRGHGSRVRQLRR